MSLYDNKLFTIYRDVDFEAFYDADKKNRWKIILAHVIVHSFPVLFAIFVTRIYSFSGFGFWLIIFSLLLYTIAIIETASYLFSRSRVFYKKYFIWIIFPVSVLIGAGGYFTVIDLVELAQNRNELGTVMTQIFAGASGVFLIFGLSQFGLNQILHASKSLYTRKAKVEADIQFAREIQKRILQEVSIEENGVSAYACSNPANELGGDFFELSLRNEQIFASIGDISGHSFGAGLLMTLSKSALQTHLEYNQDPEKVMSALNILLNKQTDRAMYATMALLKLNISDRKVLLCNAGHLPVFHILGKSSEIVHRYEKGIGLGMTGAARYKNQEFEAEKGDFLILYSDGLIETRDENMQIRDIGFLKGLISETVKLGIESPREFASELLRKVSEADYSAEMEDDTSLIVIKL